MSSDNGIYVAEFPTETGGVEYRVTEVSAIYNVDYGSLTMQDAYRVLYFGDARMFSDRKEAIVYAHDHFRYYTEYGVCTIEFDRPLSAMTQEMAQRVVSRG